MQILFEVAAVAVIILTAITLVVLAFLIVILKNIKDISNLVRNEVELVKSDLDRVREEFAKEGFKLKALIDMIFGSIGWKGRKTKKEKNGENK